MDIFLSINNREQVIQLPVVPEEFNITSPWSNQVFNTITLGDINLIGLRGLKGISWSSFFPNHDYPFLRDRTMSAWEYAHAIEEIRVRRVPVRLIITDTLMNIAVLIDEFDYGVKDGSGDVYYSISFSEFKFVSLG
jgi:hypothetical protein